MKTKRITMYIEILLFVVGIVGAIFVCCANICDDDLKNLLVSICIGGATGGMVAFLCAIPDYLLCDRGYKDYMQNSLWLLYIMCYQGLHLLEDTINKPEGRVLQNLCHYSKDNITRYSIEILKIDKTVYICKKRCEKIEILQRELNNIVMSGMVSATRYEQAYLELNLKMHQGQAETEHIVSSMLDKEIQEVKKEIYDITILLDNTMNVILSENKFKEWDKKIVGMKKTVDGLPSIVVE